MLREILEEIFWALFFIILIAFVFFTGYALEATKRIDKKVRKQAPIVMYQDPMTGEMVVINRMEKKIK